MENAAVAKAGQHRRTTTGHTHQRERVIDKRMTQSLGGGGIIFGQKPHDGLKVPVRLRSKN